MNNNHTTNMAYIARKSCGCMVAAAVDEPDHREDTANEIAEWIRAGLTVERVTVDYVRANWRTCACMPEHTHKVTISETLPLPGMEDGA